MILFSCNLHGQYFFAMAGAKAGTVPVGGTQTFTATATWTCPTGVTVIQVKCQGGGGNGGSAANANAVGGGGGGGNYAYATIAVTPGTVYTVTVASPTAGNGTNGGDTWFGSITTVLAKGGAGGANSTAGAGAGGISSTSSCVGDMFYKGGTGGTGTSGTISGAGGGGAGTTSDGGNASIGVAGTGGTGSPAGGTGATGQAGNAAGTNATGVGAGGSAGKANNGTVRAGGVGGRGEVNIAYGSSIVYPTWSSIYKSSAVTLSGGNLIATGSVLYGLCNATIGKQVRTIGLKWHFEITYTVVGGASESAGFTNEVSSSSNTTTTVGRTNESFGCRHDVGNWDYSWSSNGGWHTVGTGTHPIATGVTVGFDVDMAAGTCDVTIGTYAYTWSGFATTIFGVPVTFFPSMVSNSGSNVFTVNFGQSTFVYSVPSGYNAGWF